MLTILAFNCCTGHQSTRVVDICYLVVETIENQRHRLPGNNACTHILAVGKREEGVCLIPLLIILLLVLLLPSHPLPAALYCRLSASIAHSMRVCECCRPIWLDCWFFLLWPISNCMCSSTHDCLIVQPDSCHTRARSSRHNHITFTAIQIIFIVMAH